MSAAATVGLPGPSAPVSALAPAVAAAAKQPGPVERALRRLQHAQNRDGGFGRQLGDPSDPKTSVWATLAMVSLGIHPADQPTTNTSALEYLIGDAKTGSTGNQGKLQDSSDLAAFMLVMQAIGKPDLGVGAGSKLKERQAKGGGIPEGPNGTPTTQATALATLAFLGDRVNSPAATDTAKWLKGAASGKGWGATAGAAPRPGTTGMAVTALMAVDSADIRNSRAQSYLLSAVNDDGGFGGARPTPSEPLATGWAMLGLKAVGSQARVAAGGTGVSTATYLSKQQNAEDGGFGDTLTTAQILPGFNASTLTVAKPLVRGESNRVSRRPGPPRKNPSVSDDDSDGQPEQGSKVNPGNGGRPDGNSDGTPTGNEPSDDTVPPASDDGGTPTPGIPSSPAPSTPAPSTPAPTPAPAAAPPKPADDTVAAAGGNGDEEDDDTAADDATKQVNGVVVGARAAAAASAPGLDAGGGDAGDRGAAVLGGLIVALVLVGTQLERRRPKRIVS